MKTRITLINVLIIISLPVLAQDGLSLRQCQEYAMEHNLEIKKDKKKAEASTYLRKSARTNYFPEFSAGGTYMRLNKKMNLHLPEQFLPVTDSEGNPILTTDQNGNLVVKNYAWLPEQDLEFGQKDVYAAAVTMEQTIYAGGKVREMNEVAKTRETMASLKSDLTQTDVLYNTAKSYWKVISLKEKVELARSYRKQVDSLIEDLKNYKKEGLVTDNEVLKAKVKRNEVELKLNKAQNGLRLAQMALNQMIGFPLDTTLVLQDSLKDYSVSPDSTGYWQEAAQKRPEIQLLEEKVNMAESGVELAKSRFMPEVMLTANYYMLNPNPFNNFSNELGHDYMIGVVAKVPIFHWGDRLHTLNAAKLEKEATQAELENNKEKIRLQVQQEIFKVQEAVKQVESTNTSLNQAKENLEMTRDNFDEGMAKTTDVLEAQAMWQKAYASKIEAQTELQLAWLAFQKAMGQLKL